MKQRKKRSTTDKQKLKDKNITQEAGNVDIDNLPTPRTNNDNIEENEKMAKNDPVQDATNPPGNLSHDFEDYTFGSLEIAEVFWQTNQPGDNIPWRKMDENRAMNLKKGTLHNFIHNTVVWQKI